MEVEERKEREIVSLEKKLKFTPMSQQEREVSRHNRCLLQYCFFVLLF